MTASIRVKRALKHFYYYSLLGNNLLSNSKANMFILRLSSRILSNFTHVLRNLLFKGPQQFIFKLNTCNLSILKIVQWSLTLKECSVVDSIMLNSNLEICFKIKIAEISRFTNKYFRRFLFQRCSLRKISKLQLQVHSFQNQFKNLLDRT